MSDVADTPSPDPAPADSPGANPPADTPPGDPAAAPVPADPPSAPQDQPSAPADPPQDQPGPTGDQPQLFDAQAPTIPEDEAGEDLAAEPDSSVPEDAPPDDTDADAGTEEGYTGECLDGPYQGRTVHSRFPGFWLVDKPNQRKWTYYLNRPNPEWRVESPDPETLQDLGDIVAVAEGSDFDVIAYDENPDDDEEVPEP